MPPSHVYRARRGDAHLGRNLAIAAGLVVVLVVAWVAFALLRSLPAPILDLTVPATSRIGGTAIALRPTFGAQEAVALGGTGTIATAGGESPTPIASLTKMMSALVVLRDHPLAPGASGPDIPVTAADVATYKSELTEDDSVVAVRAGEQLSELQALEGALIPSGDNIIQLLATWDAGSTSAFVAKMNTLARKLGLVQTHYAGPSGVNPATVSTATDQLHLAEVAMANPVFASIVAMAQVTLPVAGVEYNVDADLGSDGIDGIKTGWVPQGGGCFVFSAAHRLGGQSASVLGAVLGVQGSTPIPTALSTAKKLVVAVTKTLDTYDLARGTSVGTLSAPWASPVRVVTRSPITLLGWDGAEVQNSTRIASARRGAVAIGTSVGTLQVRLGQRLADSALVTTAPLAGPSFGWRLTHL
jgi:D-alanyl-D-alanine carboxypeptidase (penicillin-binding protein 5/6)